MNYKGFKEAEIKLNGGNERRQRLIGGIALGSICQISQKEKWRSDK
jgi:hypothetical protein